MRFGNHSIVNRPIYGDDLYGHLRNSRDSRRRRLIATPSIRCEFSDRICRKRVVRPCCDELRGRLEGTRGWFSRPLRELSIGRIGSCEQPVDHLPIVEVRLFDGVFWLRGAGGRCRRRRGGRGRRWSSSSTRYFRRSSRRPGPRSPQRPSRPFCPIPTPVFATGRDESSHTFNKVRPTLGSCPLLPCNDA